VTLPVSKGLYSVLLGANMTPIPNAVFAKTDGDMAIDAAADPAGVATAKDSALAAKDAVPTFVETMAAALDDLATALSTYLISNYYTPQNWSGLIAGSANCLSK
jgi:hypothetical protein